MSTSRRLLSACASFAFCGGLSAQPSGDFTIVLDETAFADDDSARGAAWLAYGMALTVKAGTPEFRDRSADDYAIELHARNELARFWADDRAAGTRDEYLDKLVEIRDAGFLAEYVLATYGKLGWALSAAELAALDLPAFFEWADANLDGFASATLAGIEPKRPRPATPTGEALPDPARFEPSRAPCAESIASMRSALEQWQSDAAALRGAPIAAEDRRQFLAAVAEIADQEPYRTRGVVWVSFKPALLGYYGGFCAVEIGDLASAARWLESATTMLPFAYDVHQEFIHVLVAEGRFEEADARVGDILAATDDACTLARAWRRRGYIRFEQRRWADARTAYERSLEYEPGNQLALDELGLIGEQIAAAGGEAPPQPPPTQLVSNCQ